MPPDSKQTELGSRVQGASPPIGKNTGSFSAMSCMEMCRYSYFRLCGYFRDSRMSFVTTGEFSVRFTKITSGAGAS